MRLNILTRCNSRNRCGLFISLYPLFMFLVILLLSLFRQNASAADLTDQGGRIIHFEHPFTRIISLYGAHTENLARLGLDKEIIGRTGEDDYPQFIATKPVFSDRDDTEKFIAAHPDLVLIRPMDASAHQELFASLQKAGITIVSLQPTSITQMYTYWHDLGELTGKTQEADAMIDEFKSGITQIKENFVNIPENKRPKVYFESIHSKMRTFSPDSISIFSLESAGGINIASDATPRHMTNIAEYGKEQILSHAENIDVFITQIGAMNRLDKSTILTEPGFQAIKAVRDGKVYLIDEKLVSRPTMRLLKGIHELNEILYPTARETVNQ